MEIWVVKKNEIAKTKITKLICFPGNVSIGTYKEGKRYYAIEISTGMSVGSTGKYREMEEHLTPLIPIIKHYIDSGKYPVLNKIF